MANEPGFKQPFTFAVSLHILLFVAIFCTFLIPKEHQAQPTVVTSVRIIEAVAIDQQVLDKQIAQQQQAKEHQQKLAQQAREKKLRDQAQALRLKQERERQRLLALKKQQEAEEQVKVAALEKIKAAEQAELAEKQRVSELKKQANLRSKVQPKHLELQKQAAIRQQQMLEKQKRDQKRFAELAKQREASAAAALALKKTQEKIKQEEDWLQKQMVEEQRQVESARKNRYRNEIDKYRGLISQAISQYWIVPGSTDKELSCVLLIQVARGGMVLDVKLVRGSGNATLDRSAVAAVYKASPLPVPSDKELFDLFKEIRLTVRPEGSLEA